MRKKRPGPKLFVLTKAEKDLVKKTRKEQEEEKRKDLKEWENMKLNMKDVIRARRERERAEKEQQELIKLERKIKEDMPIDDVAFLLVHKVAKSLSIRFGDSFLTGGKNKIKPHDKVEIKKVMMKNLYDSMLSRLQVFLRVEEENKPNGYAPIKYSSLKRDKNKEE